ncbi:MAG: hypothetical protein JWL63_718 [Rhodocyclales bacterium]|nr:hypothetical protein [Rhodocyclales bacterium]
MAHELANDAGNNAENASIEAETANRHEPSSGKRLVLALLMAAALVFAARLTTDHFLRPGSMPAPVARVAPTTAASEAIPDEDERLAAEARAERQHREKTLVDEDRARREQKRAEIMRARDEAAAATQAGEARKDAAWQRFFSRPKKCDVPADDATRVDCSNQYIRAKERFEALYAEGKLR